MIRGSAPSFYCVAIPSAALSVSPLTITVPVLPAAFCSPGRWGTLRQLAVQNLAVVSPGHCSDGDLQCLRAVFGALRQWGQACWVPHPLPTLCHQGRARIRSSARAPVYSACLHSDSAPHDLCLDCTVAQGTDDVCAKVVIRSAGLDRGRRLPWRRR